jgi:hypothetical protein
MRERKADLPLTQRATRSTICPHCPLHWGPDRQTIDDVSPCELHCDLFQQLPAIRRIAACNDPMIRSLPQILEGAIQQRVPKGSRAISPLWRNRHRLIAFLTRLFGG